MINVHVRSVGPIYRIVGAKELDVILQDGATIEALLTHWLELHGDAFAAWVTNREGHVTGRYVRVLVNGSDSSVLSGLDTALVDGDVVSVLAVVAGGI